MKEVREGLDLLGYVLGRSTEDKLISDRMKLKRTEG